MSRLRTAARRLHSDQGGYSALQWLGIVLAVLTILSLIPQFRAVLDVGYETLVGKNNVDAAGNPAPGVLVRGIIVAVGSLVVFVGAVMLILYTNLGTKLAFLVTGTAFFGFLAMVGLLYTMYAPRGLKPASIDGLNAIEIRILPGGLMLGSLILFAMFLTGLNRWEAEQETAGA